MPVETRNIVVAGLSFGGLSAAHSLCKNVLPQLQENGINYVLHLIDPSTHFWWHIAAPRQIVSLDSITVERSFVPIKNGFKQYSSLQDAIVFTQGSASALDTQRRTLTISKADGQNEVLHYWALVIATGVKTPTPLTGFHGSHVTSENALKDMNKTLSTANAVVISGGGPIGVETAGEIAYHYQGKLKVTLVTASEKLLPAISKARAQKAHSLLDKLGVEILYNVKVQQDRETADGKTEVILDSGRSLTCDVYIPAFGVTPNTDWLPEELKDPKGYVATESTSLRVLKAGARVYAAGDVAGVDSGGVVNMYNSLPVVTANIAHDLLADAKAGKAAQQKEYRYKPTETQLVPVGPKTGVAAVYGWSMPGFAVSFIKGKDYMIGQMGAWVEGKKF